MLFSCSFQEVCSDSGALHHQGAFTRHNRLFRGAGHTGYWEGVGVRPRRVAQGELCLNGVLFETGIAGYFKRGANGKSVECDIDGVLT